MGYLQRPYGQDPRIRGVRLKCSSQGHPSISPEPMLVTTLVLSAATLSPQAPAGAAS